MKNLLIFLVVIFNIQAQPIIVIDSGGTKTRMGIWDGKTLSNVKQFDTHGPHDAHIDKGNILERKVAWIENLKAHANDLEFCTPRKAVIAVAGPVNSQGNVLYAQNLWGYNDESLENSMSVEEIETILNIEVSFLNDIQAAIYRYGFDERFQSLSKIMLITISTGIGSKTMDVQNKWVNMGGQGTAGELHSSRVVSERLQINGKSWAGKLGSISSGKNLYKVARIMSKQSPFKELYDKSLLKIYLEKEQISLSEDNYDIISRKLSIFFKEGDQFSKEVIDESISAMANVLQIVIIQSGLEGIILMGGVVKGIGEYYKNELISRLKSYDIPGYSSEQLENLFHWSFEDNLDGLYGAGLWREFENKRHP